MKRTIIGLLIALAIILGGFGIYCLTFMQKEPLPEALGVSETAQIPDGGTIVSHWNQDDTTVLDLDEKDAAEVWRAVENTNVRFIRARGIGLVPPGGYYYEVELTAGGETVCAFGFNTDKGFVIDGQDYNRSGESTLAGVVGALFGQVEG